MVKVICVGEAKMGCQSGRVRSKRGNVVDSSPIVAVEANTCSSDAFCSMEWSPEEQGKSRDVPTELAPTRDGSRERQRGKMGVR